MGGDSEPLKFNVELEFVPEFEIADYQGIEVEIPRMEVKDEDVEQVLDSYQKRFAILVPAPDDRKLDQGDIATLDVVATCEGEPFPEASHEGYRSLERGSTFPDTRLASRAWRSGREDI
jgi:trigger factor